MSNKNQNSKIDGNLSEPVDEPINEPTREPKIQRAVFRWNKTWWNVRTPDSEYQECS